MSAEPPLYTFNLLVVDCENFEGRKPFPVTAKSGETLFNALTAYEQTQNKFKFKTKTDPNVGKYVVEVNGDKNRFFRCWEVLLVKDGGEIIPINLDFKIFGACDIALYIHTLSECLCIPDKK